MDPDVKALSERVEQLERDLAFLARFCDPQARNTVREFERFRSIIDRYPRFAFEEEPAKT